MESKLASQIFFFNQYYFSKAKNIGGGGLVINFPELV